MIKHVWRIKEKEYYKKMKDHNINFNIAIIKGIIKNIYETPKGSYVITLDDGYKNYIPVFISDEHNISLIKNYNIDDYIEIEGNLQSSVRENRKNVTVFCDRIINCSPYDMRTKNEFMIQGIVKSICVLNRDCWEIVVATYVINHYSVVPIMLYNPDVRLYPQEPGEMIALRGFIETLRKKDTETQKTVYIQNFVAK